MRVIIVLTALAFLTSLSASADTWSGYLVDSKCYTIAQQNKNPGDEDTYVDRDRGTEIDLCRPSARTKSFGVVQFDGLIFTLDPAGNAQAAKLVGTANRKQNLIVAVTGDMNKKKTIAVRSISIAK